VIQDDHAFLRTIEPIGIPFQTGEIGLTRTSDDDLDSILVGYLPQVMVLELFRNRFAAVLAEQTALIFSAVFAFANEDSDRFIHFKKQILGNLDHLHVNSFWRYLIAVDV